MRYENRGQLQNIFHAIDNLTRAYDTLRDAPTYAVTIPRCVIPEIQEILKQHIAKLHAEAEKL